MSVVVFANVIKTLLEEIYWQQNKLKYSKITKKIKIKTII